MASLLGARVRWGEREVASGRGQGRKRGRQKSNLTIFVNSVLFGGSHCSGILEYLQQDSISHNTDTHFSKSLKRLTWDLSSRYPFPALMAFTASSGVENSGRSTCNTRIKGSQKTSKNPLLGFQTPTYE